MKIFKITNADIGKILIVRFLPDPSNLNMPIRRVKNSFNTWNHTWSYTHLSYALVNNEPCIFIFGNTIRRQILPEMFLLNQNMALEINVSNQGEWLSFDMHVQKNDRFVITDRSIVNHLIMSLELAEDHQKELLMNNQITHDDFYRKMKFKTNRLSEVYQRDFQNNIVETPTSNGK